MNWYYSVGQEQKGPVTEEQLKAFAADGTINGDSLVWREGLVEWQKYRAAFGGVPPAMDANGPQLGEQRCGECGKIFKLDEVIRVSDRWVCAACKPVFLQRLREGTVGTAALAGAGRLTEDEVRAREYTHDIGGYLSRSWELFKSDPGQFIGVSLLVGVCVIAANAIPYLSVILSVVFTGPLMGGLFIFYLKKIRGESATVGDAFGGFGPRFGQFLLGNFIPGLFAGLCIIPVVFIIAIGAALFFPAMSRGGGPPNPATMIPLLAVGGVVLLCGISAAIYLQTSWLFTLWLVADKKMGFWPAMSLSRHVVIKHWWSNFGLSLAAGLVAFAGILACGVGLLVTGPVAVGMLAVGYQRLFGDMQAAQG